MHRFVFRSPRLGFLAVGPALARPAARLLPTQPGGLRPL